MKKTSERHLTTAEGLPCFSARVLVGGVSEGDSLRRRRPSSLCALTAETIFPVFPVFALCVTWMREHVTRPTATRPRPLSLVLMAPKGPALLPRSPRSRPRRIRNTNGTRGRKEEYISKETPRSRAAASRARASRPHSSSPRPRPRRRRRGRRKHLEEERKEPSARQEEGARRERLLTFLRETLFLSLPFFGLSASLSFSS